MLHSCHCPHIHAASGNFVHMLFVINIQISDILGKGFALTQITSTMLAINPKKSRRCFFKMHLFGFHGGRFVGGLQNGPLSPAVKINARRDTHLLAATVEVRNFLFE